MDATTKLVDMITADGIFVSGWTGLTRLEIEAAANLPELIRHKANEMRRSFERTLVDAINAKRWTKVIEYRENTTGSEEISCQ